MLNFEKIFQTKEEESGFLKTQKLAYQCVQEIAFEIQEGWTEKKTASLMDQWLKDHGIRTFFHKSFAWFGSRSSFQEFRSQLDFLPTNKTWSEGEVIILDTAPILKGYTADIGFTFSKTPHVELKKARQLLIELRSYILQKALLCKELGEVWKGVDQIIQQNGYVNCHARYPFSVLGHRVHKVGLSQFPGIIQPFSLHAAWSLLKRGLLPELLTQNHNGSKNGFWAIEPHFGNKNFGIKFEEILVIKNEKIFWLDENVPHLKLPEGLY